MKRLALLLRTCVGVLVAPSVPVLEAQWPASAALDSLSARTAVLTARYADRRQAVADGYRRLGPDFPGMGEHWLNPGVMLNGRIDAARPTLLTYATIDDSVRLLGVGFVTTTQGDAGNDPASVPGWPDAWHEHSGLLADESGARGDRPSESSTATHVWVLHVWTVLANPAGRYFPDNWALPFARAGLLPPGESSVAMDADVDASRALALASGGDVYLRHVLTDADVRTAANAVRVDAVISVSRAATELVVQRARSTGRVEVGEVLRLREIWRELARSLEQLVGPVVRPFLDPPHGTIPHSTHRKSGSRHD